MYLVHGVPVCTNTSNHLSRMLAMMILLNWDKRRNPWPKRLWKWALHQYRSILVRKLRYITQGYMQVKQTWFVYTNDLETIVDFKQANRPKKKEWIEDYYLQIAAYAMAHDYVYGHRFDKELSWYARLTYITKNLGSRTTNYGPGNTNF